MTRGIYKFLEDLCQRSADAIISQAGIRSRPLNGFLRKALSAKPGEPGSFLADPVLEGAFGWLPADRSLADLSDSLLSKELLDVLDGKTPHFPDLRDDRYRLARSTHPYAHQLDAWKTLLAEPPSSVLVTSGTGSGKTECFLIPILEDLIQRYREQDQLRGVSALMLYPLNALINSQRERLLDWTHDFDGRIRFCLYNGGTPEQVPEAESRRFPSEVRDRATLRDDAPPILVTNITMLEYMLIRQIDAPIIEQSKGRLRWIVLDEAHTYVGSQAAEISLLLRRVLEAFEVRAEDVRFVATSATIGSGETVEEELRHFLADMAGIPANKVRIVVGKRDVPRLKTSPTGDDVDVALLNGFTDTEKLTHLVGAKPFRRLRNHLADGEPLAISGAAKLLFNDDSRSRDALNIVETAAELHVGEKRLLPVRLHLFHRAQPGLWVCSNRECPERLDKALPDEDWPWGAVFLEEKDNCASCGSILFELAACDECGEPHLLAEEIDGKRLAQYRPHQLEDEFAQGSELAAADAGGDDDGDDESEPYETADTISDRRLIVGRARPDVSWPISVNASTGDILDMRSDGALELRIAEANRCASCGASGSRRRSDFLRRLRFGAPFLLGNAIPNLLQQLPERPTTQLDGPLPWNGRQLISFTDSRQGTARFAARLQQDSERNFVRSVIYHAVQNNELSDEDREKITEIKNDLAQLEALKEQPEIKEFYDRKRRRLEEISLGGRRRGITWEALVRNLSSQPDFEHWVQEAVWAWRDDRFVDSERLSHLLLLRELRKRPKRANSAERMGLAWLRFEAIEKLEDRHIPEAFSSANLKIDAWKSFLRYLLTHVVRGNLAVAVDREDVRWLGIRSPVRSVLPPHFDGVPEGNRRWPQARPGGRQSNALSLLSYILNLDAAVPADRDRLNACIGQAWSDLQPVLVPRPGARGFQLDLRGARLAPVTHGWLCPIT
ncbi:MAG: DEAD/DEAH box helicase [Rhodospirillales bacterium]|nr:DEAD/DEAH box helicase [Rhodospirillales bacterium]